MKDFLITLPFGIAMMVGQPLTFVYLLVEDIQSNDFHGFWTWFFVILIDGIFAVIWPIYWLILHWIL